MVWVAKATSLLKNTQPGTVLQSSSFCWLSTGSSDESLRLKYSCTMANSDELTSLRSKVNLRERSEVEKEAYHSHTMQHRTVGNGWASLGGLGPRGGCWGLCPSQLIFLSPPFLCSFFHSALEKLQTEWDNKIKTFSTMKTTFSLKIT